MRFDTFIDDPRAADARVPDGSHECVITKTKEWVSPEGVKKLIVTFRPDNDAYDEFVKWFDPNNRGDCYMALAMAQHVGISANQGLGPNLVDKRIVVTTKRGTKKSGELTVFVNAVAASAHDQPTAREPAPPANRTPTQKADAATNAPADDLPF
jgi:hypothetical protein